MVYISAAPASIIVNNILEQPRFYDTFRLDGRKQAVSPRA
ncbi:hypothetical protein CLOSTASPAR_03684 [[Clostridium] asparagiforme DSM 15981]|uniref:Uncharacterized protein n=1 Tax=[Clostridium] asparagiforme DSM 15981 TaxID=518636 RepID=C0D344_9FIRM|nr:hypothetical protein CLOSTASPAR_03684 [[Clostridium] asparagiforme DSM 15981]